MMNGSTPVAALSGLDALSILRADHEELRQLFDEFDQLGEDGAEDEKQALADRICALLTVHATVEEEVFYPAAREALGDDPLLDDAEVEHETAKYLIGQIESSSPGQALYEAQVRVLGEYISHHVIEEEEELFARLADADIDLDELGDEIEQRKIELMDALE